MHWVKNRSKDHVENVKGMFGVSGRLLTVSKLNKLDTNKTVSFTSRLI